MKKLIPVALFTAIMTTSVFAGTIQTNEKVVPVTVNDEAFTGSYPAYLVNGTTLISSQDLTAITGSDARYGAQPFAAKNDAGETVVFYPLRQVVEGANGTVEWDESTMSCDITTTETSEELAEGVTLSESVLSTNGKIPVNIDGTNTYLTIESVAPVVTVEGDEDFSLKVNEVLLADQVYAFETLQNADKTTTKEVFKNELSIDTNYEVVSSEDGQVVIVLESVITENGDMSTTKTTINIDFNTKSVKVVK